jgi:putative membrane-bound dehydrogenase-like protein
VLLGASDLWAGDANRLTYLDDFCNPYYAHREFPKLTTPQWVGEDGVEVVVTLGIDDMRDVGRYESYLRPILERLKEIDGRAPVSILTNSIDPKHPHLQKWIKEGVSIETHTADHPCPCLQGGSFDRAKSTYDRCVDQISSIPGNRPVAFRFPCCDSLNTPSPRAFAEIINKTTPNGNFLQISSSVVNLFTADDPELPRELVMGSDGKPRFSRYVPFPSFVNKVENYPYPFVIDRLCWEFPIAVPDDWQGQNLQAPNNPKTVDDLKAMIDATLIKRGAANIVFHPHGWIRNDQMVALIDHCVERYGKKVKFLNFQECIERLNKNLLAGQPLRDAKGGDNGVRIVDLNDDGYLDVVIANEKMQRTRLWLPKEQRWKELGFPARFVTANGDAGVRFGTIARRQKTSIYVSNEKVTDVWHFVGSGWLEDKSMLDGLSLSEQPIYSSRGGLDQGVRLRDLDGDGFSELIVGNHQQNAVFARDQEAKAWKKLSFALPANARIVDAKGRDQGLRFVDIDEDGHDDVVFSNERSYGLHLFNTMETGWNRKISDNPRGTGRAIPMISRLGTNNGAWFAARHIWVQNEDTHKLPDGVDRMSFRDMLGMKPARAKSPKVSLRNIEVPEGFKVELVAAEPLVMDPVAMDWGPDGRLWVIEMADYPLGIDGKSKPGGRVRWLSDRDGDGVYDRSTLFLDGLSTPTGIMAWRKGVLISAAPDILYAEDTDGDGKADRTEMLFTGFGKGNEQHRVNGFAWGLDNWVYLANGDSGGVIVSKKTGAKVNISGRDVRIRPDEGLVEAVEGQTQFGRSRDDWGNWFGCNNPNPIFHFVLADRYLRRNPHFSPPGSRRDIRDGSNDVFPISPDISHCDTKHRPLGAPARFTSANSTIVYRDNHFGPAFANSTFTSEPVYNIVHRRVLEPNGVTFRSVRPKSDASTEFFRSSDAWCRPTGLRAGPDGALYIADMYREVIEHPEWINDELEKQIDVRAGHDRGRIYRVAPVGEVNMPPWRFDKLTTPDLVGLLDTPNGWRRDLFQRMLIWRDDRDAVPLLEKLATNNHNSLARLHALCALDGMKALSEKLLAAALNDKDNRVRRHAIRLSERFLAKSPANKKIGDAILEIVESDKDPHVRLQLAYSLGNWSEHNLAGAAIARFLATADDQYIRAAAMSSINSANLPAATVNLVAHHPEKRELISQLVALAADMGKTDIVRDYFSNRSKLGPRQQYTASHLRELAALIALLARRGESIEKALGDDVMSRVEAIFELARQWATDESAKPQQRLAAIQLLGRHPKRPAADLELLGQLIGPKSAPSIQTAAMESLATLSDERIPKLLLTDWEQFTPSVRSTALDALLGRATGAESLLTAIEAGQVAVAHIDAARRQRLLDHKDAAIRESARKLLAQSSDSDRQKVVEQHRDALELAADTARGKAVFQKRCVNCHRLEGVGHNIGPDLTALKDRSPLAMLTALLDPNRAVEDKYLGYEIITTDGRILNGVISEESGNHIALRDQNGKQHDILRTRIDELRITGKSLMPEGLEKDLSKQDLADVIKYLGAHGPPPKAFPSNQPAVVRPDAANQTLALTTKTCRIHGPNIKLETNYGNLGFWSSEQDRAEWTIEITKGGEYEVWLDFACDQNTAGNRFVLDFAGGNLRNTVPSTKSWDNYDKKMIGKIKIPAGASDISFHSDGAPKGFLIDLRSIKLIPIR